MLAALAAVAIAGTGAVPGSAAPAPGSRVSSGLTVAQRTLPNGLRVVVLRDVLAPVVTTWLNVEAGSDDEPFTGLAHAQEHMFYRGSTSLSGAQADEIAGFMGDVDDADTQNEITQYYHVVPAEDLEIALRMDATRFGELLDSQKDWNEERGAILQEVAADNSDALFRLGVKLQHHLMAGTPYTNEGLGTVESFTHQIQAPQLKAFYHTWYHPNNALYVIAGDIEPATAFATVERLFGALPAAPLPAHHAGTLLPLAPALYTDTSDQSSTAVLVGYRFPGYASPDYAASVVLGDVLNSARADLAALVASGRALAIEADTSPFPKAGYVAILSHVPAGASPLAAAGDVKHAVANYQAHGVPASLVEAAKEREVAQFEIAADSLQGLANLWSSALAVEHRPPGDDIAAIERVTPSDVNRVLRQYLVNATAAVAYAVPKNGASGSEGGSGAPASESAKNTPSRIEPLPAWAMAALQRLRVPEKTIDPTFFTLPNGLRVVVQPERASSAVVVSGTVLHDAGLEEPAGEAGVGSVVENLLPFGTTSYSRLGYQAQLDAIAATATAGYNFSLTVLRSHFERGLQLLADDELHPALPQAGFATVQAQQAAALAGEATSPNHLAAVAAANGLFPKGDPARHFASSQDVTQLTLDQVRAYYAKTFRPDLTTLAIVGDVTPAEARAVVERWFGAWRSSGPRPQVFPSPVADNAPAAQSIPANGRVQDTVSLRETLPLSNTDPDLAPLEVANTVLSGDFSSLLYRDMRVTTGYVYFVQTGLATGRTRSTFDVAYACAPENLAKAQAVFLRDLRGVRSTPIGAERLLRAKARLVSTVALTGQSYSGLAQRFVYDASQGLPLDDDYRIARAELGASAQDVRVAAARWIRPDGFVQVLIRPAAP